MFLGVGGRWEWAIFQAEATPHDSLFVGFDSAMMNCLQLLQPKSREVKKSLSICCVSLSKSS